MKDSMELMQFDNFTLRTDLVKVSSTIYKQLTKLFPIDKETYDDIIELALKRANAITKNDTLTISEIDGVNYTMGGITFTIPNIVACGTNDYLDNKNIQFNPANTIKKIFLELDRWIPAKYNKAENTCMCDSEGIQKLYQCFDEHTLFSYYCGRIGNPDYFIILSDRVITKNNK